MAIFNTNQDLSSCEKQVLKATTFNSTHKCCKSSNLTKQSNE